MKIISVLRVAIAAFFFVVSPAAFAQNSGTVTNHAFPLGKGPGTTGFGSLLLGSGQIAIGQTSADPTAVTPSGDVTIGTTGVTAIGANKVTNSQLNTMGANTTKCNATAGTANPTDCTAATMKTNLGLVIGTNVEAWDTDLDCLAALSSTGVIHRTGTGTCSAGSVALSDLVTGTQDTVLGYFGSTAASALTINNCSNALTYSTSTHTFGCNSSAGTGTVTTTGSPASNQVAIFSGATSLTGVAAGNVGQHLGVTGSAPAFKSGGWELLNSSGPQSAVSTIQDTTSFGLGYSEYEIVIEGLACSSTSSTPEIQVLVGGTPVTSGYLSAWLQGNGTTAASTSITTGIQLSATSGCPATTTAGTFAKVFTYSPASSIVHSFTGMASGSGGILVQAASIGGQTPAASVLSGYQVTTTSGTITVTNVKTYGRL
jgi:hypothetical protein